MSTSKNYDFDHVDRSTRQITPDLIRAVSDHIVHKLSPRQILLFGSYANGKANQDSDIDLLVILDNHHPLAPFAHRERSQKLLELFRYRSFGLDAMVLTQKEIDHLLATNEGEWDLVLEIREQGIKLYDRTQATQTQRTRPPAYARMVPQS